MPLALLSRRSSPACLGVAPWRPGLFSRRPRAAADRARPPPVEPAPAQAQPDTAPSAPLPSESPPPPPLAPEPAPVIAPALAPMFRADVGHASAPRLARDRRCGRRDPGWCARSIGRHLRGGRGRPARGILRRDRLRSPILLATNTSATLIGAGAGIGIVGALTTIAAVANPVRGDQRRQNEPMMWIGAFGQRAPASERSEWGSRKPSPRHDRSADFSTAWPLFVTAGVLTAVGIPLFVAGAHKTTGAERKEAREKAARLEATDPKQRKLRSMGMVIGGRVFRRLPGSPRSAGTGTILADVAIGIPDPTGVIGLPMLGGSTLFGGLGIPLVVVERQKKAPDEATPPAAVTAALPDVDLAGGGLRATWRLP